MIKNRDKSFRHGKHHRTGLLWDSKITLTRMRPENPPVVLCPLCLHGKENRRVKDEIWCKAFRQPITARIVACRFYVDKRCLVYL